MSLLDRLAARKSEPEARPPAGPIVHSDPVFASKALRKFLGCLTARETPVVLDLGPVVGGNVTFLGEQLGCKIFVEDIFADLDRHAREGTLDAFPAFLQNRLTQSPGSVDGILCWDLIDYFDRPSAQQLAAELTRVLRPDGALLAFFGTTASQDSSFTKFVIVDDLTLRYRTYPAARRRQSILVNRDILRLFSGLRVSDSFLLQNNRREILFRKPL
jgi:hypothetical protein